MHRTDWHRQVSINIPPFPHEMYVFEFQISHSTFFCPGFIPGFIYICVFWGCSVKSDTYHDTSSMTTFSLQHQMALCMLLMLSKYIAAIIVLVVGNIIGLYHLSHVIENGFCLCEIKDVDQPCSNCTANQHLCFRSIDSTVPLVFKSDISRF